MKHAFTLIELSKIVSKGKRKAFTLIELLVVITIIIVLLALLTPALDTAMYEARMAACSARLDGTAVGAQAYAMQYKRWYPYREAVHDPMNSVAYFPRRLTLPMGANNTAKPYDDRPAMAKFINLKMLVDPFCDQVDLARADPSQTHVYSSYSLWFGYKYQDASCGISAGRGMLKLGDPITWNTGRYRAMAGDTHQPQRAFGLFVTSSHPDFSGSAVQLTNEDVDATFNQGGPVDSDGAQTSSLWRSTVAGIGRMDVNFVFNDGGVRRYNDIFWNSWTESEPRFDDVPSQDGSNYPCTDPPAIWLSVPTER